MSNKPNLLYICTDQQHYQMMSCTGNPWLKTPNMDRLAEKGTLFSRSYAANPVCSPARFSMQTGRMPSAINMRHNSSPGMVDFSDSELQGCLGHLLKNAGYKTYFGGKEHFPVNLSAEKMGWDLYCSDQRDILADETARLIESQTDAPWACMVNFINPHDICFQAIRAFLQATAPERVANMPETEIRVLDEALALPEGIDEETFFNEHCPPLPENFEIQNDEAEMVDHFVNLRKFKEYIRKNWGEKEWRLHRWAYARLTERVDRQLGVVLDALEKSGQWNDTVIIFSSDHGDHDSAHRLEHKSLFYEESARVPFIICHSDKIPAGQVNDEHLINNALDLMATCCDYAGIEQPEYNRGLSIRPLAENSDSEWREFIYGENEVSHMLCTKDWKYVAYDKGANKEQLYDLQNDPLETRNHAAENPEVLANMKTLLEAEKTAHHKLKVAAANS